MSEAYIVDAVRTPRGVIQTIGHDPGNDLA